MQFLLIRLYTFIYANLIYKVLSLKMKNKKNHNTFTTEIH